MTIQTGANLYTQGFGSRPENVEIPFLTNRPPTSADVNYPLGKRWVDTSAGNEYTLTQFSSVGATVTANWAFLGGSSGDLNTLTTDDLTVVTPSAGNINLSGSGSITTVGAASTATVELTGLTNHNVLVGAGTTTITKVAPSATSGVALISQGAAADPAYGTVVVAGGGTGAVTLTGVLTGNGTSPITANAVTNHGVLLGGASNAVSSLAVAATGTVLAGSTGADPAFTGSPSVSGSLTAATTITATLGDITATNGNFIFGTAGNKIVSTSVATTTAAGANSFGSVTLVGGTATVSTTAVTANSLIVIWRQSVGATGAAALGQLSVGTIVAATSFDINAWSAADATALQASDVSVIGWMIIN